MDPIFYEIFELLPRQGPGDDASTKKAFATLVELPGSPQILDVGCGVGKQTLVLAGLTGGQITALDNHAPFIEALKSKIERGRLNNVKAVVGDMGAMDFAGQSFDLIWSEGAVFIIGIENALKDWKRLLRPGGYMVISELVWFKQEYPAEIRDYFARASPTLVHYSRVNEMIEAHGYKLIDYFALPHQSWWTDYYTPMQKIIKDRRIKYKGNDKAGVIFDELELEIKMHKKYSEYYGYGFFIMRKD